MYGAHIKLKEKLDKFDGMKRKKGDHRHATATAVAHPSQYEPTAKDAEKKGFFPEKMKNCASLLLIE